MREIPPTGATERERDFTIIQLIRGRSNATGTVTLAANVTATVVALTAGNANAAVLMFPQTLNAAAAVATTYVPASAVAAVSFTITHLSNAQTDRTFFYVVTGG